MKTKKKSEFARHSLGDKSILIAGYILLGLFVVAIILPVIYIILASFIDPVTLQNSGITFDFSKWTLTAYERVMSNAQIWVGFKNAVIYSILFTILSVVVTLLAAYPMSRPDFRGRGFFNIIFVITMFFGGGLIPTYLLISDLGMLDTIWAILLPGAFSVWNMIIARTYYMGIPADLGRPAGSCGGGRRDGADLFLQDPASRLYADHRYDRHVAVRRNVEQLFRCHDLPEQRIQAAAAAGAQIDPDPEPAGTGHGLRYAEHGSESSARGTVKVCHHHYLQPSAHGHVPVLPEILRQRDHGRRGQGLMA